MKRIEMILGLFLLFLFASCGMKTADLSISTNTDTMAVPAAATTVTQGAAVPNDIAAKANQAFQDARKTVKKTSPKATVKK